MSEDEAPSRFRLRVFVGALIRSDVSPDLGERTRWPGHALVAAAPVIALSPSCHPPVTRAREPSGLTRRVAGRTKETR
jgi:hypothetical protein